MLPKKVIIKTLKKLVFAKFLPLKTVFSSLFESILLLQQVLNFEISITFSIFDTLYDLFKEKINSPPRRPLFNFRDTNPIPAKNLLK